MQVRCTRVIENITEIEVAIETAEKKLNLFLGANSET